MIMIVAICGGSCSGKSTYAMHFKNACVVHMDDFYKGKSRMKEPYNFDEPDAIDLDLVIQVLVKLKSGVEQVIVPNYNMKTSEPDGTKKLINKNLIVLEGTFAYYTKQIRELSDLKIYLDIPVDERVRRRITSGMWRRGDRRYKHLSGAKMSR
jgi:uridine kinase